MQIRTVCNICKGKEFKTVFKIKEFNVLRCLSCDTLCRDIILDKQESKDLYDKDYFCNEQKDYFFENIKLREDAFSRKFSLINSIYPKKGRLLDLGCATGLFLKKTISGGWDAQGVEFSDFAARHAREEGKMNVQSGDLLDMHFPSKHFDVVTVWDMIDHSEYPKETVEEVYRILKPGGIIAMETFMEDGVIFLLANFIYKATFGIVKYPCSKGHPLHHSHYFSRETFQYLLEKSGFEVIFKADSYLEGEVVRFNFLEKRIISFINFLTDHFGRKMEMIMIGKKPGG